MRTAPNILSNDDVTVAEIDAVDELMVSTLREYLHSRGCTVIVNGRSVKDPLYHIIVGDKNFVEEILGRRNTNEIRTLALVYNTDEDEMQDMLQRSLVKVACIDPNNLSSRELSHIFSFFFTSDKKLLDVRQNPHSHKSVHTAIPQSFSPGEEIKEQPMQKEDSPNTLLPQSDKDRVSSILNEVFGTDTALAKTIKKKKPVKKSATHSRYFYWVIAGIALPFFLYIFAVFTTTGSLGLAMYLFIKGDATAAARVTQTGRLTKNIAAAILQIGSWPAGALGAQHPVRYQERILTVLDLFLDVQKRSTHVVRLGYEFSRQAFGGDGSSISDSTPVSVIVNELSNELAVIESDLGEAATHIIRLFAFQSFPFSHARVQSGMTLVITKLETLRQEVGYVADLVRLYMQIGGFGRQKTYLILFQNSMELRPAGGFIGSIGLALFSDGKLNNLEIQDVYTLDGQLKGHVDPPSPVASILGQEHWYLRDSNWNSDFTQSGKTALWFYEKESGKKVDGVIAVSTPLIIDLLRITGPIELSDYNDRITADNFYGKALYYTEENFFPGSTQKKDFLGTLSASLMNRLIRSSQKAPLDVGRALIAGFKRRDIMLYSPDSELQMLIDAYGWAGRVPSKSVCLSESIVKGSTCLFDFLSVVEANLGVNKANYFVKRQGLLQMYIGNDGQVASTTTLYFHNGSLDASSKGGGDYVTYLRMLAPEDTEIVSVVLDGVQISIASSEDPVTIPIPYAQFLPKDSETGGVGVAFKVPAGGDSKLEVRLRRQKTLTFTGDSFYEFLLQKQPGAGSIDFKTLVIYPIQWNINQYTQTANRNEQALLGRQSFLAKEGSLEYNIHSIGDARIRLQFIR